VLVRAAVGATPLAVRHRIREADTLVMMVGRGMGIGVAPRLALPDEAPAGVAFVPLDAPHRRRVGVAVRREEAAGSMARAFLVLARGTGVHIPVAR
jgi:DNA-binding transcriptional LysR family regulator